MTNTRPTLFHLSVIECESSNLFRFWYQYWKYLTILQKVKGIGMEFVSIYKYLQCCRAASDPQRKPESHSKTMHFTVLDDQIPSVNESVRFCLLIEHLEQQFSWMKACCLWEAWVMLWQQSFMVNTRKILLKWIFLKAHLKGKLKVFIFHFSIHVDYWKCLVSYYSVSTTNPKPRYQNWYLTGKIMESEQLYFRASTKRV